MVFIQGIDALVMERNTYETVVVFYLRTCLCQQAGAEPFLDFGSAPLPSARRFISFIGA